MVDKKGKLWHTIPFDAGNPSIVEVGQHGQKTRKQESSLSTNTQTTPRILDASNLPPETPHAPARPTPLVLTEGRRVRVILRASVPFIEKLAKLAEVEDRTDAKFAPTEARITSAKNAGVRETFDGRREHTGKPIIEASSVTAGVFILELVQHGYVLSDASWRNTTTSQGLPGKELTLDFVIGGKRTPNASAILSFFERGAFASNVKVWSNPKDAQGAGDVTVNFMQMLCPFDADGEPVPGAPMKAKTRLACSSSRAITVASANGPYDIMIGDPIY